MAIVSLKSLATISRDTWTPSKSSHSSVWHYSIPNFDVGMASLESTVSIMSNKFLITEPCVLISKLNPKSPRVWLIENIQEGTSVCSTEFIVLIPISPSDLRFLYFLLKSNEVKQRLADIATGTSSSHQRVRPEDVLNLEVGCIDSSPERQKCSSFLMALETRISLIAEMSKTLEEIAQTIFKSWFVDFDPVKAKMAGEIPVGMDAATASLFPDSFEDSELGPIPKGWKVRSFFDLELEIESGARPKGGVKGISNGVPSIGAESINGIGVFDFSKTKYVSEEFFEKMKKGKPRDFDTLLYKDGGKPGEFKPRVGMFGLGFPFSRFALNEHVFLLRSGELGPAFTYFWIRMERTLDVLRNRGIKAAIPGINQQDVGTLEVLWSSPDLIAKFNELCMPYLEMILTLASESLELSRLRDSLLPRLISGELQIPDEMLAS